MTDPQFELWWTELLGELYKFSIQTDPAQMQVLKVLSRKILSSMAKMNTTTFQRHLRELLNSHSMEKGSDTPDWILAQYLKDCLQAFDSATVARELWYGRKSIPSIPANSQDSQPQTLIPNLPLNPSPPIP